MQEAIRRDLQRFEEVFTILIKCENMHVDISDKPARGIDSTAQFRGGGDLLVQLVFGHFNVPGQWLGDVPLERLEWLQGRLWHR